MLTTVIVAFCARFWASRLNHFSSVLGGGSCRNEWHSNCKWQTSKLSAVLAFKWTKSLRIRKWNSSNCIADHYNLLELTLELRRISCKKLFSAFSGLCTTLNWIDLSFLSFMNNEPANIEVGTCCIQSSSTILFDCVLKTSRIVCPKWSLVL